MSQLTIPDSVRTLPNAITSKLAEIDEDGSLGELGIELKNPSSAHPLNSYVWPNATKKDRISAET